ncbi:helix-turn-helix transcriptional regulator [Streptomyces sp. SS7]|uniref:helix-turn-helix domain-containing protein n=1 Tax=Streptomyces sp. SS7 TaxID=3108485 RepID=UPI0030EF705C
MFKHFRQYTGASQTTVGSLVGLAQSDISEIERGLRQMQSVDVLTRIAEGLGIPPARLGLGDNAAHADHPTHHNAHIPLPTAAKVTETEQEQEDDVRRRELMAGALGLGASLIAGTSSEAAAAAPATHNPAAAMERALFEPVAGQPASLKDLATGLATARELFSGARYSALGSALPSLIATAEATRDANHRPHAGARPGGRRPLLRLGYRTRRQATLRGRLGHRRPRPYRRMGQR